MYTIHSVHGIHTWFFHVLPAVFLWNLPSFLHGITCIASRQVGTFGANPWTEAPEAEDASRVPPSSTIKMLTRFLKQDSTKTGGQTTKPGLLPGLETCTAYSDFRQLSFIKEKSDLGWNFQECFQHICFNQLFARDIITMPLARLKVFD